MGWERLAEKRPVGPGFESRRARQVAPFNPGRLDRLSTLLMPNPDGRCSGARMAGACERAEKYSRGLEKVLAELQEKGVPRGYEKVLEAASLYLRDARYYIDLGDCETALVAVSYAEGLVDSLKYLGVLELQWPATDISRPKVFVAGTFDLIHPGHVDLLAYAASFGKVYVVIARDENVKRLKGRKPILNENSRLRVVSSIRYVFNARLGDKRDIFAPLEDIKPDIVVLGPDQPFDEEDLASKLEARLGYRPKVIRYPSKGEFQEGMKSSSDIISKICCESYCRDIGCILH